MIGRESPGKSGETRDIPLVLCGKFRKKSSARYRRARCWGRGEEETPRRAQRRKGGRAPPRSLHLTLPAIRRRIPKHPQPHASQGAPASYTRAGWDLGTPVPAGRERGMETGAHCGDPLGTPPLGGHGPRVPRAGVPRM